MTFEDILSRDQLEKIIERGTPSTEQELALIRAQGVIDGLRGRETELMEQIIKTEPLDRRKNQ